jgi:hypothetical protein
MRCPRCALLTSFLAGIGLVLGCDDKPKGMRNMQTGTGSKQLKDLPTKNGNKLKKMPEDRPDPAPPPR